MVSLIIGESAIFTIFVVAYLFYIGKSLTGPTPQQVLEIPWLQHVCLLSSSFTIWLAEHAIERWQQSRASPHGGWPPCSRSDLPRRHRTGMAEAHLSGWAHHQHESLRHDFLLARRASCHARGRRPGHAVAGADVHASRASGTRSTRNDSKCSSLYWHFVDAVWVVVFTVVYILGR